MSNKMTKCKTCGAEMASSAKNCPQCGAKNKKPIYKKWWLWLLAVIVVIALVAGGGQDSASDIGDTYTATGADTSGDKSGAADGGGNSQPDMTMGQRNALNAAKAYLNVMPFSYEGLINQLEFEKYSHEDAVFAADNCGADWNEQALKSAKNYLNTSAFSYDGLIRQLEYEKFTTEQAVYAADNCGADWNEQAAKSAKQYLSTMSFSRDGLIDQLMFEGFTEEQAIYGVQANGY